MKIILMLLILSAGLDTAFAAFDTGHVSARPASMADSFAALADDASAPFYNPAGITGLNRMELDSTYSFLFPGLDISGLNRMFFSFVLPVKNKMAFALSYSGLSLKDLYGEHMFQLTYGQNLDSIWSLFGKNMEKNAFSAGVNVKVFKTAFILDEGMRADPLFSGSGDGAMQITFDAGLLARIRSGESGRYYSIGLSVMNLTQPDMGLKSEDAVPLTMNLGAGIPVKKYGFMEKIRMDNAVFLLGASYRNRYLNFSAGWENSFFRDVLFLRLGTSMLDFTAGTGVRIALGRSADVLLDYAFILPYKIEGTAGEHIMTLRFRF